MPDASNENVAQNYDPATCRILRQLVGRVLPQNTIAELRLPIRNTLTKAPTFGIRITAAQYIAAVAYLTSRLYTRRQVNCLFKGEKPVTLTICNLVTDALYEIKNHAGAHFDEYQVHQLDFASTPNVEVEVTPSKHEIAALIHCEQEKRINPSDIRMEAFRSSLALPGGIEWILCPPSPTLGTYITDAHLREWLRFYCRVQLFKRGHSITNRNSAGNVDDAIEGTQRILTCIRPPCKQRMDCMGDHLIGCVASAVGNFFSSVRRHDQLVRLVAADMSRAARSPIVEQRTTMVIIRRSRPDVVALGRTGVEDIIDVAVAHKIGSA